MKVITTRIVLIAGILSAVASCTSTTTVTYHIGNMFTVVATADSAKEAGRLAIDRANGICAKQNIEAEVDVIDTECIYQGINKSQQKLVKIARDLLPESKTKGPYTPPGYKYKMTLTFKCK